MLQKLNYEQRGKLFTAIMQYAVGEDPGELDDTLTDLAFGFIKAQMDRSAAKYQEICLKRAEYGRKGGLAKASKSKQNVANVAKSESDPKSEPDPKSDSESESDSEAPGAPGLSPEDRAALENEFGHDRLEDLIADVEGWASGVGVKIDDDPAKIRQFARNQERWKSEGSQRARVYQKPEDKLTVDFDLLFGGKK